MIFYKNCGNWLTIKEIGGGWTVMLHTVNPIESI